MKRNDDKLLVEMSEFDVLSQVLDTVGLRSRLFCRSELSDPWALRFAGGEFAHFHIVDRGSACLELDGQQGHVALSTGDLVVVGRNSSYRLVDRPNRKDIRPLELPPADPDGRCAVLRRGNGPATSVLLCGSFTFEDGGGHPILALLPRIMHLRRGAPSSGDWLEPLSRFLLQEAAEPRPGMQTVISRLTDILFVQVIRAWLAEQPEKPSWLRALNDPRVSTALALMHQRPGHRWSVAELASRVGLSRSPFTTRFTRAVGEPPQAYLARTRMQLASRMLRQNSGSLAQIASAVGYESESSFSKAFARQYRQAPGEFRRRSLASPAVPAARTNGHDNSASGH